MPFEIRRGTNAAMWLSQSRARGEKRRAHFTRDDVEWLAGIGLDHLRIPVDEEQLWDEDGRREEEAFELLANALDWCGENGLRAIIDVHILRSHHFNEGEKPLWTDPAAQEHFYNLWRDLCAAFESRPLDMVAYELMNEAVADDAEQWNRVAHGAIAAIRELEPERIIVLGSNKWNSPDTFDELAVPDDANLILTFHFYLPFLLTHYTASWTPLHRYRGPVHYPGRAVTDDEIAAVDEETLRLLGGERGDILASDLVAHHDRDVLAELMAKPIAVAKEKGLPLYCGEWGCISEAPRPDRMRWYADARSVFEENGIGWATWEYKSGHFGLRPRGESDRELVDILTG